MAVAVSCTKFCLHLYHNTLPSHLTTIVWGLLHEKEYDRNNRSIVDRKPEKNQ